MKIYGWEQGLTLRGELVCAEVASVELKAWPVSAFASELGWEKAFPTFKEAKAELIADLVASEADPEIIAGVKDTRASYLPVVGV